MADVAVLYVSRLGPYFGRHDVDAWDEVRDARLYAGDLPVVAHPPCNLWVNMAAQNYARATKLNPDGSRKESNRRIMIPAWYPGGDDGGCFKHALDRVRYSCGVLEHPAHSHAWKAYGLPEPLYGTRGHGWTVQGGLWVCEVWQSAYGHRAQKRTWLLYVGRRPPFELRWSRPKGTHQVGWFDREKPTVGKREAFETPPAFAEVLIALARMAPHG